MLKKLKTAFVIVFSFVMLAGAQALAQEDLYPNKVKTHIGELTFEQGIPTKETSEKLYFELDYHRAVQAYLWSLPIVGQAQWRQSYLDLYNMKPNQMVYLTKFNDRSLILTANESTPYLIGWINVKDKAADVETPPGKIIGLAIDFWQRGMVDFGMFGPFAGKGETWIFSGPDTPKDQIPYIEGAKYINSRTYNVWFLFRLSVPPNERDALISRIKVYSHGDNPTPVKVIPTDNKTQHSGDHVRRCRHHQHQRLQPGLSWLLDS